MIEIYTTDGRKIAGPMELSNGGTYVAVIPPDTFIDTGYEKYLLKASRFVQSMHVQAMQLPILRYKMVVFGAPGQFYSSKSVFWVIYHLTNLQLNKFIRLLRPALCNLYL